MSTEHATLSISTHVRHLSLCIREVQVRIECKRCGYRDMRPMLEDEVQQLSSFLLWVGEWSAYHTHCIQDQRNIDLRKNSV